MSAPPTDSPPSAHMFPVLSVGGAEVAGAQVPEDQVW